MTVEVLLRLLDGSTDCFTVDSPISLSALHSYIHLHHGIPPSLQRISTSSSLLLPSSSLPFPSSSSFSSSSFPLFLSLSLPLLGGKGGFGSLLRATTAAVGAKRTSDLSAMRDLHGRRLRHLQQEKEMKEWREREEGKTEEEKKRERRELQKKMTNLKEGKRIEGKKQCKWGANCKYRDSCRMRHPDEEEEEMEEGERKRRRIGKFGMGDENWQAQVVDEEEMLEDLEEGFNRRKGKEENQQEEEQSEEEKEDRQHEYQMMLRHEEKEEEKEDEQKEETGKVLPLQRHVDGHDEERKEAAHDRKKIIEEVKEEVKEGHNIEHLPSASASLTSPSSSFPPIDLSLFSSSTSLHSLGADHLKAELIRVGLKSGGTLAERANRLFLLKSKSRDQLPRKLWATI